MLSNIDLTKITNETNPYRRELELILAQIEFKLKKAALNSKFEIWFRLSNAAFTWIGAIFATLVRSGFNVNISDDDYTCIHVSWVSNERP